MKPIEGGRLNQLKDSFKKLLKWLKPDPTQPFDVSGQRPDLDQAGRLLANMKDELADYKQSEIYKNNHENQDLNNPGQSDGSSFTGRIRRWYETLESASTALENLFTKLSKSYTSFPTPQLVNEETQERCPTPPISLQSDNKRKPYTLRRCNHLQSSEDWIQVEPSVSTMNENTMYRLESSPGRYECRVSGLRWVCVSNVSLRYHFCSWEPHRATLKNMQYSQGGPLLDITVIAGELEEVYLPHVACLGRDPSPAKAVGVLHVEESGISIEKVCEVTCFHVKLLNPSFSPKGVLLRNGFRVDVHCDLQIYQAQATFLTLHVYLIPCDPAVEEAMERKEKLYGYHRINKPRPEKSLRMKDYFNLRTSCPSAEVNPDKLKLRYNNTTPNFFEVFLEAADIDFRMELISKQNKKTVWNHKIRKADYRGAGPHYLRAAQFVDKHKGQLIERVHDVGRNQILDHLLSSDMICREEVSYIDAERTPQGKMRKLCEMLESKGPEVKAAVVQVLREKDPYLVNALEIST